MQGYFGYAIAQRIGVDFGSLKGRFGPDLLPVGVKCFSGRPDPLCDSSVYTTPIVSHTS